MSLRLAFCAIVVLVIAASATAIALAENGLERPHWQGHGIKPPDKTFPFPEIISGYWFRTKETQAIQDDDFNNPGFFAIEQGEQLWSKPDGAAGKSCASCHQDAAKSMKGVGAAMPKWNEKLKKPVNPRVDGPMTPWFEKGKQLYYMRHGQLDLACATCHERNHGKNLRADFLSQGQSNGFPVYRLRDQRLVPLHERMEGCIFDVRGIPYPPLSDEAVALELYVAWRGTGLPVETPAVRN